MNKKTRAKPDIRRDLPVSHTQAAATDRLPVIELRVGGVVDESPVDADSMPTAFPAENSDLGPGG
jgi:hypothetical protein